MIFIGFLAWAVATTFAVAILFLKRWLKKKCENFVRENVESSPPQSIDDILDTLIVSIVLTARLKFLKAKLIEEGQVTSIERRRAELNTCNMLQLNKTNKQEVTEKESEDDLNS